MTFQDIPAGASVFLDANTLIYHFSAHPSFGTPCREMIERIAGNEISGFASSHVLSNVAHRLMTIEACEMFGWSYTSIAQRLNRHHDRIASLTKYRQAVESVSECGIQVLSVDRTDVEEAAVISQEIGLLSNDSLVVAIMRRNQLTQLCSYDSDFDRVEGVTRFSPI